MLDHTANSAVEDYTEDIQDQYPGNGFFPVFFFNLSCTYTKALRHF